MAHLDFLDSLFLQKKSVCLYHTYFQRYLDAKVGQIFHQKVFFNSFKHSVITVIFFIQLTPHFYKTLDLIGSIFLAC